MNQTLPRRLISKYDIKLNSTLKLSTQLIVDFAYEWEKAHQPFDRPIYQLEMSQQYWYDLIDSIRSLEKRIDELTIAAA